ncbi:TetR/AcrR family transcriptional regulator [Amycolatopsis sp. PS_44_ISF1]|uniref:TetR/AcrR family transcriptional regulator n=1 Tax=Amycolatopsis sp. PS_44_ISF1 TaxID=2974917 RepID=UPI0028DE5BFB|nr:TetR/AcrR family transcriptional regulator [Amycolatopsis sp. PS_44_ISF1]MDT8912096.1 TetR/AcrR family transcriptional regulator [Amycolatopsis sp. PS_44_ISF1]MDT8912244.1 TetR/AcrR family transcriptional regulator [Amycolatopsis sp. PS_44_ISF1]
MTRPDAQPSSREKVLVAAIEMLSENPGATLSVRAVAARAGVSTGSLRFHFPTQRALQDEVLRQLYDVIAPAEHIHDRHVPARDRLADCLRQILAPLGVGSSAREAFRILHEQFVAPEPTEQVREAYLAIEQETRRRVEFWLAVLTQEGALAEGDHSRAVTFLLTVLNGLSLGRALPSAEPVLQAENDTLYLAVDSVLRPR